MTPRKAFFAMVGAGVVMLVIIVLTMYFGIKALGGRSWDLAIVKTEADVANAQLTSYKKLDSELKSYTDLQELIKQVLPSDKEQSKVLAEISALVEEVGAGGLSSVQFGDSVSTGATKTGPSQTKADEIPGVFILPVNIELKEGITYNQMISLLKLIEKNQRKMQVTGLGIQPSDSNRNLLDQAQISLDVYLKP